MHFLLWTKQSSQSPNFDTFKYSGQNLPSFLCQFPKHKWVFQVLHHFSVSWKITPLYFFSSNLRYFAQKSKCKFLRLSSVQVEIFAKFLLFLKQQISLTSNFPSLFSVMRHNSSILFLAETLCTFNKRSLWKYRFGKISWEQSKVWNFALWWAPLSKSCTVSAKKL